jgi:hypothetical protein
LRETLIRMCADGPYGSGYRMALGEARYRLLDAVADERFRPCMEEPLAEGTITVDLTEEERVLLRLVAPELLAAVEEAWDEDKDYELAMRKMEMFTRPCDVPPSRESGWLKDGLTEEQTHKTFAELRASGVL